MENDFAAERSLGVPGSLNVQESAVRNGEVLVWVRDSAMLYSSISIICNKIACYIVWSTRWYDESIWSCCKNAAVPAAPTVRCSDTLHAPSVKKYLIQII